jgi:lysyl-tRNA synthetase class 2
MQGSSLWRPTAGLAALRLRADLCRALREFFHARGVLEVETPMLSAAANTDPNIRSFSLDYSGPLAGANRQRFLRTSPEFPLKRLLCAGVGDCYELGRVFRDGEAGGRHNPEFTMLEWYRLGFDHHRLMDEVAELLQAAFALVGRTLAMRRLSYRELFIECLALDPATAAIAELKLPLQAFGIEASELQRDDWLDLLLSLCIEPQLDPATLYLVHDFPPTQCALARLAGEGVDMHACRFEAYVGGVELANGYWELTDSAEQRRRFDSDNARRRLRGDHALPMDLLLLDAIDAGLPDCAGVAMGLDRLLMVLSQAASIDEVLAFPTARA